ncbi:MAG: redox-regulated ATPase YchF [Deferribacteraceae bacterium]|jgi:GTP-binding protein YchF|nr:redox-regulated ATPase YchF [Deferribacteraceae bacterium]
MGFSCGIVGLPNVGKSTIFNALSKSNIAMSANYPFCTIEPNRAAAPVPDERLDFIVDCVHPRSIVPTTVEFVDIAGLVRNAGKGEGKGNQFLMHIRQVDAIIHVVRCFDDLNITHVEDGIDPVRDISIINTELAVADIDLLERALLKVQKSAKSGNSQLAAKADIISQTLAVASNGESVRRFLDNNPTYREELKEYNLITDKPVLYLANVDEEHIDGKIEYVDKAALSAAKDSAALLTLSGKIEAELATLTEGEAREYLNSLGQQESGLEKLIQKGYELLSLVTFFTAGEKEARAWTVEKNTTAKAAAGKIHSDIERGFIKAEVVSYSDFVQLKSLSLAKEKGRLRLEGRDYIISDGDIVYFRHNAGKSV